MAWLDHRWACPIGFQPPGGQMEKDWYKRREAQRRTQCSRYCVAPDCGVRTLKRGVVHSPDPVYPSDFRGTSVEGGSLGWNIESGTIVVRESLPEEFEPQPPLEAA